MAHADNGRTRILDSAAAVLRQKGLAGAKLSEIAKGAGMLAPSIYHHFPSKDHLVEEVMMEGIYRNNRHIMSRVEGMGPGTSPMVRLRTAIVAHVDFLLTGDDYSSAVARIFDDLPEEMRKRVLAAYSSFDNYWRDLIVAAQADGTGSKALDATVVRKFLIAMLDSCSSWYRPGKLSPAQIAEQAADLLLFGFAAERP
ncbi:TetR family transcriptional regulator [Sphingomonas histidinilytica]|jgi:AcrR family transcriptional regulator|uniref:Transcriptional regulator, TetR family n=1 Tax=Rhizorhabdus histidinilytica TaxID=439228 RepID=A0A1T5FPA0_9SPHN|nr:TetR/AcrR family transcriptional regulator [Rhizorhabdus histidinilytica]MBO9377106.1 TetR family transcriptional regulator [Rhizorhabdus histidinilytica]QEH80031.1 TetR/AcrR family transcriptional regulator [Sphingomonas sp. C8-2]SKB97975.1 transcriptional regulator, TetR family [Rhizorhabdus histidinilytica]